MICWPGSFSINKALAASLLSSMVRSLNPSIDTSLSDKVFFGMHGGSKELRDLVDIIHPRLVLCGHIHEDPGFTKINSTTVVNCSMGKRGEGALIEINRLLKPKGFLLISLPNYWSLHRFFERYVKKCFATKNSYLRYQKHQFSHSSFRNIAYKSGFQYVKREYFAVSDTIYKLIPNYRNFLLGNLFLMVLQKRRECA